MARPRTVTDDAILEAARACVTEHGPGVSLSTIAARVGLSAPALLRRFDSKEDLVFRALLPPGPPAYVALLATPAAADSRQVLRTLLARTAAEFTHVGPALAALRMSPTPVDRVFPVDRPAPPVRARNDLAAWLAHAHEHGQLTCPEPAAAAELLLGAAEARGFFRWVGPRLVEPADDVAWAAALLDGAPVSWPTPSPVDPEADVGEPVPER